VILSTENKKFWKELTAYFPYIISQCHRTFKAVGSALWGELFEGDDDD
jgi:hypothetical protein